MNRQMLLCLVFITWVHAQEYTAKLLVGSELQSILPFMAQQRIAAFCAYPYLYEGNQKEENEHCQWFASLPHSAVVVAYANNEPVGYISGTSVEDFDTHFKGSVALFKDHRLDPKKCYYIPDAIIAPAHRKHSLINRIYALLERYAKENGYSIACCAEESHARHPLKPADYHELDGMFIKGGFIKSSMIIKFPWQTIQPDGTSKEEEHALRYWIKNL